MSRVTMRIDMIRTPILITDDGCEPGTYQANANGYDPFRFQAESLGNAVDTVTMQCGNFRRSAEQKVKSTIRSEQAKKRWAELKKHSATTPSITPAGVTQPKTNKSS